MTTAPTIAVLPRDLIPAAVDLWHETGLTRPWNDPVADCQRALVGPDSTVLAAISADGTLAATAMVGHDGHRGWIYYMAVRPDLQGRGLGAQMVAACEEWLRRREIVKSQLMVRSDNTSVIDFYEHLGYAASGVAVLGKRLDS